MADYIVVSTTNGEIMKLALGMLGARYLEEVYEVPYEYPMQGPTLYIWPIAPNVAGDEVAFGPLDTGIDEPFGPWCLGKELVIDDGELQGSITIPSTAQTLGPEWFQ